MTLETVTVRMGRSEIQTPWGFRLQGGQEFNSPLQIGKVAPGSLADRAGLHEHDRVKTLCGRDATPMRHKDAQDVIVASANNLDLVVTRTGGGQNFSTPLGRIDRDTTISKFQHSVHNTGGMTEHRQQQQYNDGPPDYAPPPPPQPSVNVTQQHHQQSTVQHQHQQQHQQQQHQQQQPLPPNAYRGGNVTVSLEHQSQGGGTIPGFNVSAAPFASQTDYRSVQHKNKQYTGPAVGGGMEAVGKITYTPGGGGGGGGGGGHGGEQQQVSPSADGSAVSHLQYNSPMALYSPGSAAQAYRQQTGTLFGADQSAPKDHDSPAYLQSATLRLIQEEGGGRPPSAGGAHPRGVGPHHQYHQHLQQPAWAEGRDQTLHHTDAEQQSGSFRRLTGALGLGDGAGAGQRPVSPRPNVVAAARAGPMALSCTTCGSSTETEYMTVDGKPYCGIHAKQRQGGNMFGPTPVQDPSIFFPKAAAYDQNTRIDDPVKGFQQRASFSYQPDIMSRGPVKPHAMPVSPTGGVGTRTTYNYQKTSAFSSSTGGSDTVAPGGGATKSVYQSDSLKPGGPPHGRAASPISPSMRGVPTRQPMYGADLPTGRAADYTAPPPPPLSSAVDQPRRPPAVESDTGHPTKQTQSYRPPPERRGVRKWPPEQEESSQQRPYWRLPSAVRRRSIHETSLLVKYNQSQELEDALTTAPPAIQRHRLLVKSDQLPTNQVNKHLFGNRPPPPAQSVAEPTHLARPISGNTCLSEPTQVSKEGQAAATSDTREDIVTQRAVPDKNKDKAALDKETLAETLRKKQISLNQTHITNFSETDINTAALVEQSQTADDYSATHIEETENIVAEKDSVVVVEQVQVIEQNKTDTRRNVAPPKHRSPVHPVELVSQTDTVFMRASPVQLMASQQPVNIDVVYEVESLTRFDQITPLFELQPPQQTDRSNVEINIGPSVAPIVVPIDFDLEERIDFGIKDHIEANIINTPQIVSDEETTKRTSGEEEQRFLHTVHELEEIAELSTGVETETEEQTQSDVIDSVQLNNRDINGSLTPTAESPSTQFNKTTDSVQLNNRPTDDTETPTAAAETATPLDETLLSQAEQAQDKLTEVLNDALDYLKQLDRPDAIQSHQRRTEILERTSDLLAIGVQSLESQRYYGPTEMINQELKRQLTAESATTDDQRMGGGGGAATATGRNMQYSSQQQTTMTSMNQMHGPGAPSPGAAGAFRGRGVLKQLHDAPRVPVCEECRREIRGPFVLAVGKTWCPEHFCCSNGQCNRKLLDIGFVEENGKKYCEVCFESFLAPKCAQCTRSVTGDCLNALNKQWHPECFTCAHCRQPFGSNSFFLENGQAYCEKDWNQLFTTKCVSCQFPIEAGDRWVEALGSAYHSNCFTCTTCNKNLEGASFYAKGGKPYCKAHA